MHASLSKSKSRLSQIHESTFHKIAYMHTYRTTPQCKARFLSFLQVSMTIQHFGALAHSSNHQRSNQSTSKGGFLSQLSSIIDHQSSLEHRATHKQGRLPKPTPINHQSSLRHRATHITWVYQTRMVALTNSHQNYSLRPIYA